MRSILRPIVFVQQSHSNIYNMVRRNDFDVYMMYISKNLVFHKFVMKIETEFVEKCSTTFILQLQYRYVFCLTFHFNRNSTNYEYASCMNKWMRNLLNTCDNHTYLLIMLHTIPLKRSSLKPELSTVLHALLDRSLLHLTRSFIFHDYS